MKDVDKLGIVIMDTPNSIRSKTDEEIIKESPGYNCVYLPNGDYLRLNLWTPEIQYFVNLPKGLNILEIGTGDGGTSSLLSLNAAIVVTIDIFDSYKTNNVFYQKRWIKDDITRVLNSLLLFNNLIVMAGPSKIVVPCLQDRFFDAVFIDADHTYEGVKDDYMSSYSKLKDDGIFIFHDYDYNEDYKKNFPMDEIEAKIWETYGVKKFVDELYNPQEIERVGCSAIVHKKEIK